jgi:uncharacterized Zn finger protein
MMSRWYGGWAPYVPVAERRRRAERAMEKRRKAGHPVSPVNVSGRAIATTFWGRAWCDNMESYRDFENRLPRGQTYVRNGSVVDLQIAPGRVAAMVSGSELYEVAISVKETPKTQWRAMCSDCAGGIDSLVELLQGRLSKAVMERLCRQQGGLFPRPSDIRFSCSCPDYAVMCKHVAAVLYGVGARLDHQPELLFRLRAVDAAELVAEAGTELALPKQAPASGRVLQVDDVSALFGLDMAAAPATPEKKARSSSATALAARERTKTVAPAPREKAPPSRKAAGKGAAGAPAAPKAPRKSAATGAKGHGTQPAGAGARWKDSAAPTKQNGTVPTKSGRAAIARTVAAKPVGAAGGKQKPVRWW